MHLTEGNEVNEAQNVTAVIDVPHRRAGTFRDILEE
jgi:hypothetical protein